MDVRFTFNEDVENYDRWRTTYCDELFKDIMGYPKAWKVLKPGGNLALFWNRPFVSREDDELHQAIRMIYQNYRPSSTTIIEQDIEK